MHLYPLQSDPYYDIYTGLVNENLQVIIGLLRADFIILVTFDSTGKMIEVKEASYADRSKKLSAEFHPEIKSVVRDYALELWFPNVKFEETVIHVRKFALVDRNIGIEDLPSDLQYFLEHEAEFSIDEKPEYLEQLENWRESRCYVLWWGRDYWCNPTGLIIAS